MHTEKNLAVIRGFRYMYIVIRKLSEHHWFHRGKFIHEMLHITNTLDGNEDDNNFEKDYGIGYDGDIYYADTMDKTVMTAIFDMKSSETD